MATVGSPFASSGTAQRLPHMRLTGRAKLTIRVSDANDTDRILFSTDPNVLVTASRYNGFVNAGESVEFTVESINSVADVSIIAASGTPDVSWGIM